MELIFLNRLEFNGEQSESLLQNDSLFREFVIGRKSCRVGADGWFSFFVQIVHSVNSLVVLV